MLFSTMVSEKQTKRTYYNFQNNETNPERFIQELNLMSKKLIYFLMYSGVPKEVIPLVLCKASNYNVNTILKLAIKIYMTGRAKYGNYRQRFSKY